MQVICIELICLCPSVHSKCEWALWSLPYSDCLFDQAMVCFLTPSLLDHIMLASYAFHAFLHTMIMVYCCISAIRNPVFRWESCKGSVCERVWRIAQVCAKKQGLTAGSCGWLATASCQIDTHVPSMQKLKRRTSYSLQDKSSKLARPFARGLNSRLNPVTRSSRQNTLFSKIWLFTFLLTLLYIYPYTHDLERASRENFEREILEKTRLTHPLSLPKRLFKFLYSRPLHC